MPKGKLGNGKRRLSLSDFLASKETAPAPEKKKDEIKKDEINIGAWCEALDRACGKFL